MVVDVRVVARLSPPMDNVAWLVSVLVTLLHRLSCCRRRSQRAFLLAVDEMTMPAEAVSVVFIGMSRRSSRDNLHHFYSRPRKRLFAERAFPHIGPTMNGLVSEKMLSRWRYQHHDHMSNESHQTYR